MRCWSHDWCIPHEGLGRLLAGAGEEWRGAGRGGEEGAAGTTLSLFVRAQTLFIPSSAVPLQSTTTRTTCTPITGGRGENYKDDAVPLRATHRPSRRRHNTDHCPCHELQTSQSLPSSSFALVAVVSHTSHSPKHNKRVELNNNVTLTASHANRYGMTTTNQIDGPRSRVTVTFSHALTFAARWGSGS